MSSDSIAKFASLSDGSLGCGGCRRLVAFAVWSPWLEFRGGRYWPVVLEGFLDSPCGGGADALVDRVCLVQQLQAFVVAAISEVGLAE
jgi:hypothetical protein